jgi:hypothetical protein
MPKDRALAPLFTAVDALIVGKWKQNNFTEVYHENVYGPSSARNDGDRRLGRGATSAYDSSRHNARGHGRKSKLIQERFGSDAAKTSGFDHGRGGRPTRRGLDG